MLHSTVLVDDSNHSVVQKAFYTVRVHIFSHRISSKLKLKVQTYTRTQNSLTSQQNYEVFLNPLYLFKQQELPTYLRFLYFPMITAAQQ